MKLLFLGSERAGITHGGEYEIVKAIKRPGGFGYVVVCDDGGHCFVDCGEYELIAE